MNNCMQKNIKSSFFDGRNRNNRNIAKHLGKAVQVNFHASLFHDIHHVQSHDDGFSKLEKLECKIKISLKTRSIDYIYDNLNVVIKNTVSRNLLFYRICGKRINTRGIYKNELLIFKFNAAFLLFNGNSGPVGNFKS